MDDRTVLAGSGDRGEAFAAESVDLTPECQQRLGGGHFGFLAGGGGDGQPMQEAADSRRVAEMSGASTLLLGVVFAGFRE